MEKKLDLRVEKTYRALIQAFEELLTETSFDQLTVNALCDRALVRRATFYKHFTDKYDFFRFYMHEMAVEMFAEVGPENWEENLPDTDPAAFYMLCARALMHFLQGHQLLVQRFLQSSALPLTLDMITERVEKAVAARLRQDAELRNLPEIPVDVAASFYAGGLVRTLRAWIEQKNRRPEEELLADIERMLRRFFPAA